MKRLALVGFVVATGLVSTALGESRPPNVVYVMADELGYFEPGFMGNPNIRTPNLDQMAARGDAIQQHAGGFVSLRAHAMQLLDRQT